MSNSEIEFHSHFYVYIFESKITEMFVILWAFKRSGDQRILTEVEMRDVMLRKHTCHWRGQEVKEVGMPSAAYVN
jgi:hypothetical protein